MKFNLALLALAAAFVTPLKADVVETNITIALKFYANTTEIPLIKGNSAILNYGTGTIKNSDIISAINYVLFDAEEDEYSTKSKILRRDVFDDEGNSSTTSYLIRDKDKSDLDITDLVNFDYIDSVVKSKISTTTETGTISLISTTNFQFTSDPDFPETSEDLNLYGLSRTSVKVVSVKNSGNLVDLASLNAKVAGYCYFFTTKLDGFFGGIAEGTIKASGAKVVPAPLL